jgi:hypothetical protein
MSDDADQVADESSLDDLRKRRSNGAAGSPGLVCWLWDYQHWR